MRATSRLGLLVVGQSPRADVQAEVEAAVGAAVTVELHGALDGLSREELDALVPRDDADTLFTRLPDGSGVRLSKRAVVEHGQARLAAMAASGYDVVMVLCTGEFVPWMARYRVVFPSRVMASLVSALHPRGPLGVFTPLPEQAANTERRWCAAGHDARVVVLSPNATDIEVDAAAAEMAGHEPSLLVFDCISYTAAAKRTACRIVGAPGILAVTAAARVAAELLD